MGKILVIDDETDVRDVIADGFQGLGHTVHEASNGFNGITAFDLVSPNLVIVDVFMPGMDGIEVLFEIRRRDRNVPVIMISGGGRGVYLQFLKMTLEFGANHIIEKPFLLVDLVATAMELMRVPLPDLAVEKLSSPVPARLHNR